MLKAAYKKRNAVIMINNQPDTELIQKYRWGGKIRLISASILFVFLLLMKFAGGYSYLNPALMTLIVVEAFINQPYSFFLKKVNLCRFQYYQMATDIIAISWVLYCLGGIEAPVVIMAYCAVILWAGVVSGVVAVFFAVLASSFFLSSVVLLEHFGMLPHLALLKNEMATPQVFGLLIGNVSFLFAFGYFSAGSSSIIKFLQRKRQEESLRYTHRLSASGYLMNKTAHDMQGCLAGIRGSVQVLQNLGNRTEDDKKFLKMIEDFEQRGAGLIHRLAEFSKKPNTEFTSIDINGVIEDALELTQPLIKYSRMIVEKNLEQNIPLIIANKDQLQEVFVAMILNSLDSVSKKSKAGLLTIETSYLDREDIVEIVFSDTGVGIKPDDLKRLGEPFFSMKEHGKGSGLGLAASYDIIARHNGRIDVKSMPGEGATFTINLPRVQSTKEHAKAAIEA